MVSTENKDARAIANDLHDDLNLLQALVHAMDCIAYSNAFRGKTYRNLDCEAVGYLALIGHKHAEKMRDQIEKLRYAVGAPDCPSCVAAMDALKDETTERPAHE